MRYVVLTIFSVLVPTLSAIGAEPLALMKTMDGFRKNVPPPRDDTEGNGLSFKDVNGTVFTQSHLAAIAKRLEVKTKVECLVLLTYLKDKDLKMRFIAAIALENVLHAFPDQMSFDRIQEIDSDRHREMIQRFIEKTEKLSK